MTKTGWLIYTAVVSARLFLFIFCLTLFSFAIRLYRLTEPNHYYFDEVYHVVTAKAYANNNSAAYDPYSAAPEEGTAYDWLHPPLAKLIQAGSIKIFGDKPLGWRLPSTIFGTAIIPTTFVLGFLLFGQKVAVFSSLIIAFENLTLVMSRITMNDVFLVFFVLVSFIFANLYLKSGKVRHLFFASLFLGLCVATKWSGLWAIIAVSTLIFWHDFRERKLKLVIVSLIVFPFLIYLISYGQFWLQGHTISQFIDLHKQIWWYQNRADLEHPYGTTSLLCVPEGLDGPKSWCPWILDARPVYFSYEEYQDKTGYIYSLGNPLIFWIGVGAIYFFTLRFIKEKKKENLLVILGYFIFWLPWIFTPRILFMYHYLPSIPFMAIAMGTFLNFLYLSKFKLLALAIMVAFIISFFYFYPITSGYPIDPDSLEKYLWLKTWR